MRIKKTYCIFVHSEHINQILTSLNFLIKNMCKSFDNFYIINVNYLKFFPPKNSNFNIGKKIRYPKNLKFFNPKNFNELNKFCENKKIIAISNINRDFNDIKIHLLLNKLNIRQVIVSNFGHIQGPGAFSSAKGFLKDFFFKKFPQRLVILLSIFNLVPKVDIRFESRRDKFNWGNKNIYDYIGKVIPFFELKYTKKFIRINSLIYDFKQSNPKKNVSSQYIVLVDTNINHKDAVRSQGKIGKKKIKVSYKKDNIFLDELSRLYKKKIVVYINTSCNLDEIKSYLNKNILVKKYQTQKYIFKAFIVVFYDSTAITDAIFLKKKIISLENHYMGQIRVKDIQQYPKKVGIRKFVLDKDKISNKKEFLEDLDNRVRFYDKYIRDNLSTRDNTTGMDKVISIIKKL